MQGHSKVGKLGIRGEQGQWGEGEQGGEGQTPPTWLEGEGEGIHGEDRCIIQISEGKQNTVTTATSGFA